jgi:hypothetical protein
MIEGSKCMTNLDIANMTEEEFLAAYEKAKATKAGKQAINTASMSLSEQVDRFENTSFSEEEEQAIFEDAISV